MSEGETTERVEFLIRLGKRLQTLRQERNLSQEGFGVLCDRSQHYISQVEKGRRNVSILTVRAFATGLDMTLSELLDGLE